MCDFDTQASEESLELWGFVDKCREDSENFWKVINQELAQGISRTNSYPIKSLPLQKNLPPNTKLSTISYYKESDESQLQNKDFDNLSTTSLYDTDSVSASPLGSPSESGTFPFPSLPEDSSVSSKQETKLFHTRGHSLDSNSHSATSTFISSPKTLFNLGGYNSLRNFISNNNQEPSSPSRRLSEATLNNIESVLYNEPNNPSEGPLCILKYSEAIELFEALNQALPIQSEKHHHYTSVISSDEKHNPELLVSYQSTIEDLRDTNESLLKANENLVEVHDSWNKEKVDILNQYNQIVITANKAKRDLEVITSKHAEIQNRACCSDINTFIDTLESVNDKLQTENEFLKFENRQLSKKLSSLSNHQEIPTTQKYHTVTNSTTTLNTQITKPDLLSPSKYYTSTTNAFGSISHHMCNHTSPSTKLSLSQEETNPKNLNVGLYFNEIDNQPSFSCGQQTAANESITSGTYDSLEKTPEINEDLFNQSSVSTSQEADFTTSSQATNSANNVLMIAKERILDLDSILSSLVTMVKNLEDAINFRSVALSDNVLILPQPHERKSVSFELPSISIESVDNLCQLLILNYEEFNRVVEGEQRIYNLELVNEDLVDSLTLKEQEIGSLKHDRENDQVKFAQRLQSLQGKISSLIQENTALELKLEAVQKQHHAVIQRWSHSRSNSNHLNRLQEQNQLVLDNRRLASQLHSMESLYAQSHRQVAFLEEDVHFLKSQLRRAQSQSERLFRGSNSERSSYHQNQINYRG